MDNAQVSKHYKHSPDPASTEGMDDFLNGVLDRVFEDVDEADEENKSHQPLRAFRLVDSSDDIVADALFQSDNVVSPGPGIFSATGSPSSMDSRPSLFEADPEQVEELTAQIKLLEAQLDFRNDEITRSLNQIRFLEGQVAIKDDQLRLMPELIKRGLDATRYEFEISNLKDKLSDLSADLSDAQKLLDRLKGNWLGRMSYWMVSKDSSDKKQS